jgi:calcineurin-like phosphoesterase
MGPVEALVQPLGAAWAGALLVSGLAFRRRAWLAGVTSLCLAGGLWLVGGTPFSALLLARLERPYDRIHPVTLPVADAVVVDMHAEATSEKMAMGHFCDGRASLVVGTHTHVPTADAQILNGGTAYQTDAGACADYDSVIGNHKEEPLRRFTTRISQGRYRPAEGPATICGVYVETDDRTGLARRIEPIRMGGRLTETVPQVEALVRA